MLFANQAGDGLELPPLDVFVKATGTIYNYAIVSFDPTDDDIEYNVDSGRIVLTGVKLATSATRSVHIHGVAFDKTKAASEIIATAGERVKVRVIGAALAKLTNSGLSVSAGDYLTVDTTTGCLSTLVATSTDNQAALQGFKVVAFVTGDQTVTGQNVAGTTLTKVAFNGFGWGNDEYSEA